ncbi:MAG: CoA-binding protein [Promethearchaeota archaeon]
MSNNHIVDLFINPKSVAVIGASKNPAKGGHRIVNNLIANNFKGKVFPVNPNSDGEIFGLEFKKSVLDIQDEVDLAIFYTPNQIIPNLLKECIKKGIKGALIETAGFEEVGEIGLELRDQILDITDNFSKIRIVGPNCMGLTKIDGDSNGKQKGGFFSGFGVFHKYKRGNIAIITQSGMLNGGYLINQLRTYPDMGIRYSFSIGNKMDLNEIEFLDYCIDDPTVNVIIIYLESFKDPRRFIELGKKVTKIPNKTIILLKGGKTSLGQKATLSHTGALAENQHLINAIIKQSGVIQAENLHDLFQFGRTFSRVYRSGKKLPKYGNVSMMAGSGGAGTISADLTMKYGLNYPILKEQTYKTLKEFYPEWMPPNHFALLDLWPTMEKAMMNDTNPAVVMGKIWKALFDEPDIEGIFNMMFAGRGPGPGPGPRNNFNIEELIQQKTDKIISMWMVGEPKAMYRMSKLLNKNNILTFPSIEEMVKNFAILVQESKNKSKI